MNSVFYSLGFPILANSSDVVNLQLLNYGIDFVVCLLDLKQLLHAVFQSRFGEIVCKRRHKYTILINLYSWLTFETEN